MTKSESLVRSNIKRPEVPEEVLSKNLQRTNEPAKRDAIGVWIAESLLSGYRQRDLTKLYEKHFGKSITNSAISRRIRLLKEEWKIARMTDMDIHIGRELERLDVMEYQAWEHYRTCGGAIKEEEIKDLFGYDGDKKTIRETLVVTKTKDDPRLAMQWFDRILKIQTDRRKVLKLETTVSIQNIMAIKGYSVFDPRSDWPANEHLPKSNIVDLEFEKKRKQSAEMDANLNA